MIIKVHDSHLQTFINRVNDLNEKASALGMDPSDFTSYQVIGTNTSPDGTGARVHLWHEIDVTPGAPPAINGWTILGSLEHLEDGNIVYREPGVDEAEVPVMYRERPSFCDHCATNRKRNRTFVLSNGKDQVQVGSTCVKQFTGHTNPKELLSYYDSISDFNHPRMTGATKNYAPSGLDIMMFVGAVVERIERGRGINKMNKGRYYKGVGSNTYKDVVHSGYSDQITPIHVGQALTLVEWIRNMPVNRQATSEYMSNLKAAVSEAVVTDNRANLVGSVVAAKARFDRVIEQASAPDAGDTPVPSGQGVVEGKVLSLKEKSTPWGLQWKMLVADARGFRVYGTRAAAISNVKIGDTVRFKAELKPKEAGFGFFSRPKDATVIVTN